ncbi:MAG TPA: cytochrome P450 [Anaerolineae bacterium]|nr:cytochrome P450 [Ardenticatenia bacterium]HQZ71820.1 cytochrome P450 [Anaerolineae bacterium]
MSSIHPPGPAPTNLLRLLRGPVAGGRAGYFRRLFQEFGDLVHIPVGRDGFYLISDVDLIQRILETDHRRFSKGRGLDNAAVLLRQGLLTSEGALHERQRRLIMPAFHREPMRRYAQAMTELSAARAASWQDGQVLDMAQEMMHLTRAIVARCLFSHQVGQDADSAIDRDLTTLVQTFAAPGAFLAPVWMVEKGLLPGTWGAPAARRRMDAYIRGLIRARRAAGADDPRAESGDLLAMLLAARDEDGGRMSEDQIRDEVMTLFLAGHETTANALSWTWYLLSEHPEADAALAAELDRVLDGREPTEEDLPRLSYTRAVLSESMRLYPPAWIIGRRTLQDEVMLGYGIPAGSNLLMSQWLVHHDARHWPQPERFRPERWLDGSTEALPKYAYFPFGGGPRRCIGEAFAWTEGMLALAAIARLWRPRLVPGHPVEPQPLITLRPRHGIRMRLERRA